MDSILKVAVMATMPHTEKSYWRDAYTMSEYSPLNMDMETDVAIVGAGITGLTAAYLLKQSGYRVIVLEKRTIGAGTSGRTTGKVTSQHNIIYTNLQKQHGTKAARIYGQTNQSALNQVISIVEKEKMTDVLNRQDNYVYTDDPKLVDQFKKEAQIAAALDLPASIEMNVNLPFNITAAVKFQGQAYIHSQKYLLGIARAIDGNGSYIFENSNVTTIRDGNPGHIRANRSQVNAKQIIIATNVPTFPTAARAGYCVHEYPTESYIIAGRPKGTYAGMYISPDKNHYSILPVDTSGGQMLLVGGEGHISGLRLNKKMRYRKLAKYAEKHFGITKIDYYWSDRDYSAYDGIPLVGKLYPWSKNVYVATAYGKWGLTNGTAAAMILADSIRGIDNPAASLFSPHRTSTVTSIPRVVAQYAKHHFST